MTDRNHSDEMEIDESSSPSSSWESFFENNPSLKNTHFVTLLREEFNFFMQKRNFDTRAVEKQASMLQPSMDDVFPYLTVDQVTSALKILKHTMEIELLSHGRGASITDGLDIEMVHDYDLKAFGRRVDDLFRWHDDYRKYSKYLAPYFPFVQSSGMGKTKILTAYRDACNAADTDEDSGKRHCLTILCEKDGRLDVERRERYYDRTLFVSNDDLSSDEKCRDMVWDSLNDMLKGIEKSMNEVVLLFDEAQGLMKDGESRSIAFRVLRWWLRKADRGGRKVVAVFAGTTAKLANFFPPDSPPSAASRASKVHYRNYHEDNSQNEAKLVLYEPFYQLNTIACLRRIDFRETLDDGSRASSPNDVERAAIYGRPLFAHYALQRTLLVEKKLTDFAKRLVLSRSNFENYLPACLSVLGSRVQMGAVDSFDTLRELVGSGYACLVDFHDGAGDAGGCKKTTFRRPTAHLTFMPDPVIAWLAMHYMDEESSLTANVKGKSKRFWVEKAALSFQTQLCVPAKGDVGEVFAALYMLMCGDELRKAIDPTFRTLGVLLEDWFHLLKNGGKRGNEPADTIDNKKARIDEYGGAISMSSKPRSTLKQEATDTTVDRTMTVSFIQVCRNEMRANSFCEPTKLEHLYRAGLGCYAYHNCKGIDIMASIRIAGARKAELQDSNTTKDEAMILEEKAGEEEEESFHPLLVSVKNWATASKSDVFEWEQSMKKFLDTARGKSSAMNDTGGNVKGPTAVCIILLVGCSDPPSVTENDLGSTDLSLFPKEDVFRFVYIPNDDAFGISETLQGLASASVRREMYSSHGFVPGESTPRDFSSEQRNCKG